MHIQIILCIKFYFEQTILHFLTKFTQERCLCSKTEKVNIITEFHLFKLVLVPTFSLNWTFWVFLIRFSQKKIFQYFLHNSAYSNCFSTKFQLKATILTFWIKFAQKSYFQSKTEQAVQGLQAFDFYVVNVNSTVAFKHFEDLKDLIILNILKEKLVMSCPLRSFYLNFV